MTEKPAAFFVNVSFATCTTRTGRTAAVTPYRATNATRSSHYFLRPIAGAQKSPENRESISVKSEKVASRRKEERKNKKEKTISSRLKI